MTRSNLTRASVRPCRARQLRRLRAGICPEPSGAASGTTSRSTLGRGRSTVETAKSEAANVKDTAAGAASGVKDVAKGEVSNVATEAKYQARNLVDQTRSELRGQASNQQSQLAIKAAQLGLRARLDGLEVR